MRAAERASQRAGTKHKRFGWGASTIRAILYNEKYAGTWRCGVQRERALQPEERRRIERSSRVRFHTIHATPATGIASTVTGCALALRLDQKLVSPDRTLAIFAQCSIDSMFSRMRVESVMWSSFGIFLRHCKRWTSVDGARVCPAHAGPRFA